MQGFARFAALFTAWMLLAPASAQQPTLVGFLSATTRDENLYLVDAFRQGLRQMGFVEGTNVLVEYRWAENHRERITQLADDLVARKVAVLATAGGAGTGSVVTTRVPVISIFGSDPVKLKLASSFNRPGGNISGVTLALPETEAKRLEVLHDFLRRPGTIAIVTNPDGPSAQPELMALSKAASTLHRQIQVFKARNTEELEATFAMLARQKPAAIQVAGDPFFNSQRQRIVELAAQVRVPAVYEWPEFVEAGGLMSYSTNLREAYRALGIYVGRVLKGDKPGDLPIVQPTKFELVLNLNTARTMDIMVPPSVLLRADRVIE